MSLIDMTSDLTSIKYGRDRRGGGNSGQPYFTKDIPERLESMNFANSFLGNDFLIRGGVKSISSVLEDEIRLSKWFSSFKSPNGLLFIAKQNLLNRHRPKTGTDKPERLYTPLSTLGQAAVNSLGYHFVKDGLLPVLDDDEKYLQVTQTANKSTTGFGEQNQNKLLLLYETNLITPTADPNTLNYDLTDGFINAPGIGSIPNLLSSGLNTAYTDVINYQGFKGNLDKYGISLSEGQLLNYQGGPNTLISGRSVVRKVFNTNQGFERNKLETSDNKKYLAYSLDMIVRKNKTDTTGFGSTGIQNFTRELDIGANSEIETGVSKQRRQQLLGGEPSSYTSFNRTKTFGEGNPGQKRENKALYHVWSSKSNPSPELTIYQPDLINAQTLYNSRAAKSGEGYDDFIKFHIGVLNLDNPGSQTHEFTWVHFRAALTSFSDNYQASWNPYKYIGRGNTFYKYDGYTRGISMGFDVVVSSKYEQPFVYDKLNYLASTLSPNYSSAGYMRGNIIKLTVGDYLSEVYGILNSINYVIPQESLWDIGRKPDGTLDQENSLQLPQYIQVSNFTFTPIHNFKDEIVPNSYVNGTDNIMRQNYIGNNTSNRMTHEARKNANNMRVKSETSSL